MTFRRLAEYLEKLEGTSSRLEMTRILARLLAEISPSEARLVAYLTQGRLGPAYSSPDFGVADKMMLRALGERAGELFRKLGDLGMAAERLKSQILNSNLQTKSKLQIRNVYERLLEIAQVGGEGSQERKLGLIRDLLESLDPLSAKYAVKIILGKLRTGFSDMTVLDSLSWMIKGDKSLRSEIEKMYNVRADLGEIMEKIKRDGGVRGEMSPKSGTPVLVARAERAKTIAEIWERMGATLGARCAAEHKLDGLRIQAHVQRLRTSGQRSVKLFSRGLEDVTGMYPDIVEGLKKQIKEDCILDGEVIAVNKSGRYLPFQETVQRKRKYEIEEMRKKVPLKYYVFDLLAVGRKGLLALPNKERWRRLGETVMRDKKNGVVRLIPRQVVKSEKEIEEFFDQALREGTEGIMVKKLDGVYRSGSRDFNWIKYKKSYDESGMADTIDAVVMGFDRGEGKRSGFGIGGFLIGVRDKDKYVTVAKVGTGLKDDEWREMKSRGERLAAAKRPDGYEVNKGMNCDVWVRPEIVVEIKADEITKSPVHSSGFALRFPRLVAFREIKVEEVASKGEVVRLFKLQRGGEKDGSEDR